MSENKGLDMNALRAAAERGMVTLAKALNISVAEVKTLSFGEVQKRLKIVEGGK